MAFAGTGALGKVVASARVALTVDSPKPGLAKAERELGASTGRMKNQLVGLGKAMGLAFGATAVVAGIKTTISAASNLGEQINKASVVFRGSEKDILAWGKTTANSIGISNRAALEAAGTFGNMLVPMGFARDEAAKMSQTMVELAADMASFNNASPEDVLLALRSGLAGETEPLRRLGVFLNAARIEQEALNLGLGDGKSKLDAAAKAQATYSIILKDTTDAQGDFERTSGSLANRQRTLRAQFEDIAAKLGRQLLPAVEGIAKAISDMLPGLIALGEGVNRMVGFFGGWEVAAGFILSGLLASRLRGVAQVLRFGVAPAAGTAAAATAALGVVGGAAAGGLAARLAGLARFLKFGLVGAVVVGGIELVRELDRQSDKAKERIERVWGGEIPADVSRLMVAAGHRAGVVLERELRRAEAKLEAKGKEAAEAYGAGLQAQLRIEAMRASRLVSSTLAAGLGPGAAMAESLALRRRAAARPELTPAVSLLAEFVGEMGGTVSSGFRSQDTVAGPGVSFHTKGKALDILPDEGIWRRLLAHRSLFVELFGPTYLPQGGLYQNGKKFTNARLQAQHQDHIHVAFTGSVEQVKAIIFGGAAEEPIEIEEPKRAKPAMRARGRRRLAELERRLFELPVAQRGGFAGAVARLAKEVEAAATSAQLERAITNVDRLFERFERAAAKQAKRKLRPITAISEIVAGAIRAATGGATGFVFEEGRVTGETGLRFDPKTKKYIFTRLAPDVGALLKELQHLQRKVLPGLDRRIAATSRAIQRLARHAKKNKRQLGELRNKLRALKAEREQVLALAQDLLTTLREIGQAVKEGEEEQEAARLAAQAEAEREAERVAGEEERAVAEAERALTEVPAETRLAIAEAGGTPGVADDIAALRAAESALAARLAAGVFEVGGKTFPVGIETRITLTEQLNALRAQIARLIEDQLKQTEVIKEDGDRVAEAVWAARSRFLSEFAPNIFTQTPAGLVLGSSPLAGSNVTIVQNFTSQPDDPHVALRRAQFAAEAVLG